MSVIILPDSLASVVALLSESLPSRQAQVLNRALITAARSSVDLDTITPRLMDWLLRVELPQQSIAAAERVNASLRLVADARTQDAEMRDAAADALWEAYQEAGSHTCAINEVAGWAMEVCSGDAGSSAARAVQWALKLPNAHRRITDGLLAMLK